jgi:hypothetical protein
MRDSREWIYKKINKLDITNFIQYIVYVQEDTTKNNTITPVRDSSLCGSLSLSQIAYYSHYLFYPIVGCDYKDKKDYKLQ